MMVWAHSARLPGEDAIPYCASPSYMPQLAYMIFLDAGFFLVGLARAEVFSVHGAFEKASHVRPPEARRGDCADHVAMLPASHGRRPIFTRFRERVRRSTKDVWHAMNAWYGPAN